MQDEDKKQGHDRKIFGYVQNTKNEIFFAVLRSWPLFESDERVKVLPTLMLNTFHTPILLALQRSIF